MRIVHFSDWHWTLDKIPEADLYVCSGDMYDNYPKPPRREEYSNACSFGHFKIVPSREWRMQNEAAALLQENGGFRQYLGSPDSQVVCVAGNHDFTNLGRLFKDCNFIELIDNEIHEVCGLRVTGHCGIPEIYGTWNHEVPRGDLMKRVDAMQAVDLFVTHYPPNGVLDASWPTRHQGFGLDGMLDSLRSKFDETRENDVLHCFGHIHEDHGVTCRYLNGTGAQMFFSNAATTYNILDYDGKRWSDVSPL